jgi:hypothetical protein
MPPVSQTAVQLGAAAGLDGEARALLREAMSPREYVDALVGAGRFADAVRVIAHALPKRESVWWAWVCARRAAGEECPPPLRAALDAAEKWIAQPAEDNRRAAMRAGETAGFDTPAGCACLAAFLSGPSMAPPEAPAVPPGPHDSARAVAGAVIAAAVSVPEMMEENFRAFAQQGLEVAARIKLW